MKKIVQMLLMITLLTIGLSQDCLAATHVSGGDECLKIELYTEGDSYSAGEVFDLNVKVTNIGAYELQEVRIESFAPDTLICQNSIEGEIGDLAAGQSKEVTLKMRVNRESIWDVFGEKADTDEENAKDSKAIWVAVSFFAAVIIVLLILLVRKNSHGSGAGAAMFCLACAALFVWGDSALAFVHKNVEVPFKIEIDNQNVECKLNASYDVATIPFNKDVKATKGTVIPFEKDVLLYITMIDRFDHEDFAGYGIEYIVTVDDKDYKERVMLGDDGSRELHAEEYNCYPVIFTSDGEGGFDVRVTDRSQMPPALQLSGNPEDEILTEKYEYYEGDDYIVYFDKRVRVKGDFIKNLEIVMAEVEKQTGYRLDAENEYSNVKETGLRELYFAEGAFEGIDPYHEKLAIYISHQGVYSGLTGNSYMVIDPTVMDFDKYTAGTIVYDLCLLAQSRNGAWLSTKAARGYGYYMAERVINSLDQFDMDFYKDYSHYMCLREAIPASKAEKLYRSEYDVVNKESDYGFRFMHFLHEEYGEDVFHRFLDLVNSRNGNVYMPISIDLEIECLKEVTEDSVFEKFGKWHEKNRSYYESPYKR